MWQIWFSNLGDAVPFVDCIMIREHVGFSRFMSSAPPEVFPAKAWNVCLLCRKTSFVGKQL